MTGWTRRARWIIPIGALLLLTACAAGSGSRWAAATSQPAGFFAGFWHGLVLVFTLIVSFFSDQVQIYEAHNTGAAYDIGFVLGTMSAFGSVRKVSGGGKKTRD